VGERPSSILGRGKKPGKEGAAPNLIFPFAKRKGDKEKINRQPKKGFLVPASKKKKGNAPHVKFELWFSSATNLGGKGRSLSRKGGKRKKETTQSAIPENRKKKRKANLSTWTRRRCSHAREKGEKKENHFTYAENRKKTPCPRSEKTKKTSIKKGLAKRKKPGLCRTDCRLLGKKFETSPAKGGKKKGRKY